MKYFNKSSSKNQCFLLFTGTSSEEWKDSEEYKLSFETDIFELFPFFYLNLYDDRIGVELSLFWGVIYSDWERFLLLFLPVRFDWVPFFIGLLWTLKLSKLLSLRFLLLDFWFFCYFLEGDLFFTSVLLLEDEWGVLSYILYDSYNCCFYSSAGFSSRLFPELNETWEPLKKFSWVEKPFFSISLIKSSYIFCKGFSTSSSILPSASRLIILSYFLFLPLLFGDLLSTLFSDF